ncbi:cupredoxin domain-containing protein [Limosilactobacillus equigenerosi]|uniref:EfeO-type cupredoxin-like domain-containing protein n=1 Tax=Limosilactobacillus equigenerosi DSM 18793 = JCM 14505 TaxID=1423742 RepID=A0A0R1UTH8_9LACO|nr:cupredoxin domain-containing protein [Limosilactobacillus equigenerosi]KRL96496.1 hypothetical protein FC21_GL001245 [Limosilactobacillus equigenerosi DSM 18793 = JCM 14505]
MTVLVGIICVVLIAGIAWWFFGHHATTATAAKVIDGQQVVDITVQGGYSPDQVTLQQGMPAVLRFHQLDASSCLDEVVFPELGIQQALPYQSTQSVEIDTTKAGEYNWACGMNMFHGKVTVK